MELKVVGKASLKRSSGFRFFRGRNQKNTTSNSTTGNGSGGGVVSCTEEGGVVRMKIVMTKSDLKQLIEAVMGGGGNGAEACRPSSVPSLSVEQRLNLLRKKDISRANAVQGNRHKCWRPVLQSIPEEL